MGGGGWSLRMGNSLSIGLKLDCFIGELKIKCFAGVAVC